VAKRRRRRQAVVVSAAVVEREGRFLVTRRLSGTHLAGLWEFPGGKCRSGEGLADCLRRELREELGVEVEVREEILATEDRQENGGVKLHFFRCVLLEDPRPMLGQEIRWASREDLGVLRFPPADTELLRMLRDDGSECAR
jgi:mutator protein MutT